MSSLHEGDTLVWFRQKQTTSIIFVLPTFGNVKDKKNTHKTLDDESCAKRSSLKGKEGTLLMLIKKDGAKGEGKLNEAEKVEQKLKPGLKATAKTRSAGK